MGLFSSIAGFIGAGNQKKAAGQAAAAQVAAAQRGMDTISTQNAATQASFSPYLTAGDRATSAISELLGLGSTPSAAQAQASSDPNAVWRNLLEDNPGVKAQADQFLATADRNSPWFAEHGLNEGDVGFAKWWQGQYGQNEGYQLRQPEMAPSGEAGGLSPQDQQASAIQALRDSPLFKMLYGTGEESLLSNAAATGGLRGGNTQRGLADFGSDTLAKVIQQQLANLGGLSSQGLSAAGTAGGLGMGAAGSIADLFGAQGAAQAGGILGKANAQNAQLGHLATGIESAIGSFSGAAAGASTGSKIASMFF